MGRKPLIIQPRERAFNLRLAEIWQYRDLLGMYIRRDITTLYKQTLLGPLWFFIQPALTTLVYMFVFGGLAGISTDGIPQPLFYLAGITLWNYFAECLTRTSDTFIVNQSVFGKVYFPRMVVPLSVTVTGMIKMGIQLLLFLGVFIWYTLAGHIGLINGYALLFPVLILLLGGLGLGFGIIISSLTTKYRDLRFLITFGIQLWMFASPVIYPLSVLEGKYEKFMWIIQANPLTPILETFKYGFLGAGSFSWGALGYSAVCTVVVLLIGAWIFNRVERSFMDVV